MSTSATRSAGWSACATSSRSRTSARWTTPSRFPPQEFKLDLGKVLDQQTGETHTLVAIEDDRVYLRRGKDAPPPAPAALIPSKPIDGGPLRKALVALADRAGRRRERVGRRTVDPSPRAAATALRPPRRRTPTRSISATLGLDRVQPPGAGPARNRQDVPRGAHGRRGDAGRHARRRHRVQPRRDPELPAHDRGARSGDRIRVRRDVQGRMATTSRYGLVDTCEDNDGHRRRFRSSSPARRGCSPGPSTASASTCLFIDEAGQFSLANAIAVAAVGRERGHARRPAAAASGHQGRPSRRLRRLGARAPSRWPSDDRRRARRAARPRAGACTLRSARSSPSAATTTLLRSRAACANRRVDAPRPALRRRSARPLLSITTAAARPPSRRPRPSPRPAATLLAGGRVTDDDGIDARARGRRHRRGRALQPRRALHRRTRAAPASASEPSTSSRASRRPSSSSP